MGEGGFFDSKTKGASQFWQGLQKVKHLFKWGATFKTRNGKHRKFWEDCWANEVPLCISHENLYRMVRYPHCSVADCWEEDEWDMEFRRALSVQEHNDWLELLDSLHDYKPEGQDADVVLWALESKNFFFYQVYL